jgi:hypothetical protein
MRGRARGWWPVAAGLAFPVPSREGPEAGTDAVRTASSEEVEEGHADSVLRVAGA